MSFESGTFVVHPEIPGLGHVAENHHGVLVVEAFDSPANPVAMTWKLSLEQCTPVLLPVEQRVYRRDPDTGRWEAGRVMAQADNGYAVRFPDREWDQIIPVEQLRVRWEKSITSPAEVLVAGAIESPYYRDARLPMLHSLIDQRQACASFTAVLSSAVEIYSHQIDTALTVLSDPVQRYLLADEVGLGKTIEAGLIIRQLLIDSPQAHVAVLAPEVLRRQWQDELLTKFFIDDFPKATVKISSHDNPEKWTDYHGYDLVVVDEVHFLTRSGDPRLAPYPQLAVLAHSVERLLLLSATPSTARADRQLALLHLLDPDVYRWEDLPAFTERFAQHRELANAMDTFDPGFESLLPSSIAEIREMLPADPRFEWLSANVLGLLDNEAFLRAEADRPALGEALDALRAHLAETYRLHRRTIRHRRARVIDDVNENLLPFDVTGRRAPTLLPQSAPATVDALLEWQQQVAAWIFDHTDEPEDAEAAFIEYGDVLAVLTSRLDGLSDDFAQAVQFRLGEDARTAQSAGLSAVEREILREAPVLPFEAETLIVASESDDSLIDGLLLTIGNQQRTVVFCGSGQLAGLVANALRDRSKKVPVFEHTAAAPPDKIDDDLRQWRATGGVVIADATAEDGVNLQQADAAVHLRLPWSPNRLEQRIGRIDRYAATLGSMTKPADHFVIALGDTDHSFSAAWTDLLVHAFGAWTTSMSAIQDRLDALQVELWALALRNGPQRMCAASAHVVTAVADESKQIQVMDALDAVADSSLGEKIAVRIGQSETRWQAYERDARRYVAPDSGGIRFTVTEPASAVEFGVDTFRKPLISPLMLTRQFGRLPAGSMRGVFNRTVALRNSGLRLFRLGNPFISGLDNVIKVDERGQASAMLRRLKTREPLSFFGFDLLVEADLTKAVEHLEGEGELALRRYADALFPPILVRVWLRAGADDFVRDSNLLTWLNRDYDNLRDENLGRQISILADVFGGFDRFGKQVRTAEKTSVETFANEASLRTRADRARSEAQQLLTIYRTQAEARQAAGRLVTDAEGYLFDVVVREAVVNALAAPAIRVMAASCVVGGQWTNG
ncbi:MAG: hypothetical protein K0U84_06160 [Actinomycetia bacterium]|nr:hypothetical protein [Actinomycetes bacterium]